MKYRQLLAMAAVALSATGCDKVEAPDNAATEPAEKASRLDGLPPQTFVVSGQDITLFGGRGHIRIPEGWRQRANSDAAVEIEAQRYTADLERWAMCHMVEISAVNFTAMSQEGMNRYIETLWKPAEEEFEAKGTPAEIAYPEIGENVRGKMMSYTVGEVQLIMYAIFVIDGALMHGVHISCDVAAPATDEDRADISLLAGSFRYDAR